MSDRPTVSIYSCGRIQQFFYLKDWSLRSVLYACTDVVRDLAGATDYREIRTQLGLDPDEEYDEGRLMRGVSLTEFDAIVDLTGRVVFHRTDHERIHGTLEDAESSRHLIATPGE